MIGLDQTIQASQQDELARYLDGATVSSILIRAFWKENQITFPALVKLARDVLLIPATGAGVERLFNTARDVYHYRRGSLNATTIQEIMLYRFTVHHSLYRYSLYRHSLYRHSLYRYSLYRYTFYCYSLYRYSLYRHFIYYHNEK
ncbi:uncharacterized protein N7498_004695 [Penicillium cinerascens]|uniref:HAT C-terminal dimerisation domain-containing protein n=1 Tax=Penicillium cinerascens TaxID=70096 RepID=A0A9W9MLZ5_9EURO|nr:uncharacterized protein N7498_004695 [Penicillium cinerascens]KAJ5203816.1 hypothetical protein N7498_004695 [Penicillium cinerascens]